MKAKSKGESPLLPYYGIAAQLGLLAACLVVMVIVGVLSGMITIGKYTISWSLLTSLLQ